MENDTPKFPATNSQSRGSVANPIYSRAVIGEWGRGVSFSAGAYSASSIPTIILPLNILLLGNILVLIGITILLSVLVIL